MTFAVLEADTVAKVPQKTPIRGAVSFVPKILDIINKFILKILSSFLRYRFMIG